MARLQGDSAAHDSADRQTGAIILPLPWVARRPRRYVPPSAPIDPDDYLVSDRALIGIGIFVAIFVGVSVWLMDTIHNNSKKEDCLMSGRKNCFPISTVK